MKKRKNRKPKQLTLFDSYGQDLNQNHDSGIETGSVQVVEFLSRLEDQKNSTGKLLNQIMSYENLADAIKQVRKNKGACGVDEQTIDQTVDWIQENHELLIELILAGKYKVSAVRQVDIPKPDGGIRTLGIPTAQDRIIQQAIHRQLTILYDRHFSENSYGFRPNRGAHGAVKQASQYVMQGYKWVVDIDLEKYFDTIPHDRLMQRLSKGIGDKRLLKLINQYLKAGMMKGGLEQQRIKGSPQGGPLSPLLSNIVLDELDKELEKRGHKFCRYADDCNIFVKSRKAGERVMESVIKFIEGKLKLKVNRKKSGVRLCEDVRFLGYTICTNGKIRVSNKSLKRLKHKIIKITKRNRGISMEQMIKELNAMIQGWGVYYNLAETYLSDVKKADANIRNRLRCYRIKQAGGTYTIVKLLRMMGLPSQTCWNIAYWRRGYWAKSIHPKLRQAMSPSWFSHMGLRSLEKVICKYGG